jgi:hypothetical protein
VETGGGKLERDGFDSPRKSRRERIKGMLSSVFWLARCVHWYFIFLASALASASET